MDFKFATVFALLEEGILSPKLQNYQDEGVLLHQLVRFCSFIIGFLLINLMLSCEGFSSFNDHVFFSLLFFQSLFQIAVFLFFKLLKIK